MRHVPSVPVGPSWMQSIRAASPALAPQQPSVSIAGSPWLLAAPDAPGPHSLAVACLPCSSFSVPFCVSLLVDVLLITSPLCCAMLNTVCDCLARAGFFAARSVLRACGACGAALAPFKPPWRQPLPTILLCATSWAALPCATLTRRARPDCLQARYGMS
jgi:hypothetical protein